jgi:hypothetical protein
VAEHHCVEFTLMGDGVALRNSQQPMDVLVIGRGVWRTLVAGIKTGAFEVSGAGE